MIKRYDIELGGGWTDAEESPTGKWVKASAMLAMQKRLDAKTTSKEWAVADRKKAEEALRASEAECLKLEVLNAAHVADYDELKGLLARYIDHVDTCEDMTFIDSVDCVVDRLALLAIDPTPARSAGGQS